MLYCPETHFLQRQHLTKIRTRRSTFLTDGVILNCFPFKLIKKLSNGIIDIFLIVPPIFF
jgi:hypothetical protein